MAWVYLFIAGVFEVIWAVQLKETQGFTKLLPSLVTAVAMAISFYFLALATKTLPIGLAYAVWTGIGSLGTVIVGIIFLRETYSAVQYILLVNLFLSIVGLKLFSTS